MKKYLPILFFIFSSLPESKAQTLAAGREHSLFICNNGTVNAWGYNWGGQLGNGGNCPPCASSSVPVNVDSINGITAVDGGGYFSMALKNDGTLWTWGYNGFGQLGNGTSGLYLASSSPVQINSMAGAVRIDGGGSHSLVLKNDGTVWASGYNVDGELGNGTNTNSNIYVQVNFLTGVKAIAAGGYHSLAVKNGYVWSWGGNGVGQLGIGTGAGSNIPVPVQCIKDIIAVSAGQYNSLALKNDGTVWIWGSGGGNIPVLVDSLSGITAISTGWWHSLSLKNDGTVWAWGENSDGQLGNGSYSSSYNPVPAPVNGLTDIIEIAAAEKYSLALKNDGTVWTWGSGITTPVLVNGLCLNVTAVNEIADENIFSIFPNPSTGKFTIQSSEKISSLTIKNELGQTIYSESKKDFAGEYNSTIDLSNQPKGVYFIDMLCGNERRTRKIILE